MMGRLGESADRLRLTMYFIIYRSFVTAWQSSLRIHEMMAENRLRFAQRLNEMGDELNNLAREVDKNRKQVRGLVFVLVIYHSVIRVSIFVRLKNWLQDTSELCKSPKGLQKDLRIVWTSLRKSWNASCCRRKGSQQRKRVSAVPQAVLRENELSERP
jgi:hypothetical protein